MSSAYLDQYKNKLKKEIEEKENVINKIELFEEECVLFLQNNNDFVPANEEKDLIKKILLTIKNLENSIKDNQKDINNIKISQAALNKVTAFSGEDIIKSLEENILLIEAQNDNIEQEINSIKIPMNDFMKIKIDCPFCKENMACQYCNNTGKVTLKSLYFKKSNDELYSKNNNLAHEDIEENDEYKTESEKTSLDGSDIDERNYSKGRQTKFIITRE